MSVQPGTTDSIAARGTARRGLVLYCALVVAFDAVFVGVVAGTGDARWILALMWSVAVASVICRLVLREGFGDVSFRPRL